MNDDGKKKQDWKMRVFQVNDRRSYGCSQVAVLVTKTSSLSDGINYNKFYYLIIYIKIYIYYHIYKVPFQNQLKKNDTSNHDSRRVAKFRMP